jgi:DNA-binding transcriptional ArsR family regulator
VPCDSDRLLLFIHFIQYRVKTPQMVRSKIGLMIFALTAILLYMPYSSAVNETQLSYDSAVSTNIQTKVLIDSRGDIHLLWTVPALNGSGPAPGIWYSKYDPNGTSSLAPTLIVNSSLVQSADMVVDTLGNAHIVWAEQYPEAHNSTAKVSKSNLYYAKLNSTDLQSFSPVVLTGGKGAVMWPSLVMDNNQTTYVVWTGLGAGKPSTGLYYGLVKGKPVLNKVTPIVTYNETLLVPPRPHIAYDNVSNNLHLAWTTRVELPSGQISSIVGYAQISLKWNNVTKFEVANQQGPVDDASVAVAPRGSSYVVWESSGSNSSNLVYVAQISQSGKLNFLRQLTGPAQIAPTYLTVSSDSQGDLYVLWYQPSVPLVSQAPQVSPTSTSISYLKMEQDGNVAASWNDVVSEPVVAITISNSGNLYAISPTGIIQVTAPRVPQTNLLSIQLVGAVLAFSIGFAGALTIEDFRYRLVLPFTRRRSGKESYSATAAQAENDILKVLSRNPGLRISDLRNLLPKERLTIIKLVLLERKGYVSSVRTGLKRRFYYNGLATDHPILVPQDPIPTRIVQEIASSPGIWEARLAQNLGLSQQIVHYHLRKLQTAGFLSTKKEGKRKFYWLPGSEPAKGKPPEI